MKKKNQRGYLLRLQLKIFRSILQKMGFVFVHFVKFSYVCNFYYYCHIRRACLAFFFAFLCVLTKNSYKISILILIQPTKLHAYQSCNLDKKNENGNFLVLKITIQCTKVLLFVAFKWLYTYLYAILNSPIFLFQLFIW